MSQEYEKYTQEDQDVWRVLFERQITQLPSLACETFMKGLDDIQFKKDSIPNFIETNKILKQITGWELYVVPGLIDNKSFFELLKAKKFPATTWLRKMSELDYLEEPDMFHDVFGHVPLLTNQNFCDFLEGLSVIALKHIEDEWAVELLSRIYWYTVEFGLIENEKGLKIYGAGILSSSGESTYSLRSKTPSRVPYDVKKIFDTPYIKDKFQEIYFVIDSYEQLFNSLDKIEELLEKELVTKT